MEAVREVRRALLEADFAVAHGIGALAKDGSIDYFAGAIRRVDHREFVAEQRDWFARGAALAGEPSDDLESCGEQWPPRTRKGNARPWPGPAGVRRGASVAHGVHAGLGVAGGRGRSPLGSCGLWPGGGRQSSSGPRCGSGRLSPGRGGSRQCAVGGAWAAAPT